ncbi:methyl-accepting chemotaxis protein [Geodermatophilus sp. DSM 45219]|uniref:methyl-accepting chemotaxis protein n=1 Tax=Geodermatophilus sp. DSM 45219 TaxID=1881103 RepID=UPI00089092F1|nr:methyl-accepting chemotaxis protein [Geodermatophilus sp. DSM 45219]SDO02446.1 methyl-accepting chemotaxis protein [Geodermatophilus sp. DSM 45219]
MPDRTPPTAGRSGWFADRPLSVKFGALAGVSVLAFGGLVGSVLVGNSAAREADQDMTALVHAQGLVLQLDTRASELKVDAFRALVREVPAEARTEVAEDTATADELLTELSEIELTGESATAVAELRASFDDYTAAVGAFVDTAVADQAAARAGYEQIQVANDLTDGTVGAAKDALEAATEDAEGALVDSIDRTGTITQVVAGIGVALILAISWLIMRSITRPLQRVKAALEALAAGDLTASSGVTSRDELGQMGASLDEAVAGFRAVMSSVVASADAVAASSEELSASSAQIAASAEETSAQSGVVAGAAEEVSRNVQTVAAGAEQMGASIREIASNAAEASDVAHRAVSAAETTTATVSKLGESSKEIGDVVKVITSIAEQTNLLALNATIEAARAGEAGKGFAVVANEVKELAQETAKATEDIARRVQAIQGDTTAAVTAIGEISSIVAQISDRQTTIASAVEEQTATTNEMSRSVTEAASGSGQIADNITGVSAAADSTTQALTQTRTAVDELSRMAADLRTTVGRFTY